MKAEEYLSQARMLNRKISNKMTELAQLKHMVSGISSPAMGERVQGSASGDKFGTIMAKIADMKKEIDIDIDRCVALRTEIIKTIEELEDPVEYNVLHLYYIQEKNISQISKEIGYSYAGTKIAKRRAVEHIQEKVYPEISQSNPK